MYDGYTKTSITAKAHLVMVTGDMPGIAKVFGLKGHNGLCPCRFCEAHGIHYRAPTSQTGTMYCPLQCPRDMPEKSRSRQNYTPSTLPLRTHDGYLDQVAQIRRLKEEGTKGELDEFQKIHGRHVLVK